MPHDAVTQQPDPSLTEEAVGLAFVGLAPEEILALREGTAWKHFPARGAQRFAHLLSLADIDAYLRTDGARSPRVAMADDSRQGSAAVPTEEYALPDGRVDLPRLYHRFDKGASLVLSQFQDTHPPLARFCRGLEKFFLHGMQTNIYLTPRGAQGFRTHYDTHDVLVMQVSGRKRWRVWDKPGLEYATRNTPWPGDVAPEGEPHVFVLEPGEALYIPRGIMHDAATEGDEPSLHITLGFVEVGWGDLLGRLIAAEEAENPALRHAVPTWRLGGPEGIALLLEQMAERLRGLAGQAQAERLSVMLLDGLNEDRQPLPARGLFPAPIDPARRLRMADGMHHHVAITPDGMAALHWTCGNIPLNEAELGWLEALTEGASADELGEGALEFMQALNRNGLLEAA
ncbi:hypothetical protein EOD42_05140 [Rhodovarius crocodyli]|uniref:Ribosomal oxygenase 2 n=1 Tax=Rhodovarius crocodyli TaxID=1979269 RepID=A0A437MPB0_9PROT|nr:cupin domain-containing protein [Rhodovarius crocodyli]RVT99475.1 hypothetical protein EOD42_05140 [Rhodovarius crocodyli]